MLRCLLTIQPAIDRLKLPVGSCLCHGACFEYGCAGTAYGGTPQEEIIARFPDFQPVGFNAEGLWDYRGSSSKEVDAEFVARAIRIVKWLRSEAASRLRMPEGSMPTVVLATHQTLGDVICHLLMEGSCEHWEYGTVRYRLQNASGMEILLQTGSGGLLWLAAALSGKGP
eukprot:CAMPEP_0171137096 /NCGR_PEP_ID=MMETSP0766_2-20121228/132756_1 /TAXON_ID=439317 /ORGANISM="Gambierdiscus australes, Strain CAWD 149" /LENGTH=169 /DNA_ID=CAMNT_0011600663 /DNA_START=1 /DNA_END=505 /DNA_ORIENTATION=-